MIVLTQFCFCESVIDTLEYRLKEIVQKKLVEKWMSTLLVRRTLNGKRGPSCTAD